MSAENGQRAKSRVVPMVVVVIVGGVFFWMERDLVQRGLPWFEEKEEERELLSRMSRLEGMPGDPASSNEDAIRKRIASSSVVLFTELQERDGKGEKVVVEVLKLRTDVECFYGVGDSLGHVEWVDLKSTPKRRIHFFRGNPADSGSSMTIHRGRLLKQRDLPESLVRRWIEESRMEKRPVEPTYFTGPEGRKVFAQSWDQLMEESGKVVLEKVEMEGGKRTHFAKEVFQLDPGEPVTIKPGDLTARAEEVKMRVTYCETALVFYDRGSGLRRSSMNIVEGRILGLGGMPVEVARERLHKLAEARKVQNVQEGTSR